MRFDPDGLPLLPGAGLPDLGDVLAQPAASVWADAPGEGGAPAPDWTGRLEQGEELVPRTAGSSRLLAGPAPP